jgi:hypothetical protein
MHILVKAVASAVVLTLAWFGVWYAMLAGDVARVKASLAYHNEAFRATKSTVNFKADAVYPTGFPFRFAVGIDRPTLSMVDGDESFSVSFARVTLTPLDAAQGTYRLNLPAEVEALYAKNGQAPEHYFVTADMVPQVQLSARDAKARCGPMTGTPCPEVAADAVLASFALGLPKTITLTMTLNGASRAAAFPLSPIAINVPVFQPIPADVSWSLQLFVGVLREALVHKTPGNEVPAR